MPGLQQSIEGVTLRFVMGLPPRVQRLVAGPAVRRDGQQLAVETQTMLRLMRWSRRPSVEDLPVDRARAELDAQAETVGGRQPIGAVRDLTVPGPAGPLPLRLYTPTERLGSDAAPTMLFIHGGGMSYGSFASHEQAARFLAENSGVQLLAVDYRLAPEHPFPAAVEDCLAAYESLVANAAEVGADPARLAVGGDSAGGYLSATTAIQAAERGLPLAFQLLVYPCTEFVEPSRSRRLFADGFYLTGKFIDQCTAWFFSHEAERHDPLGSLARRTSFPEGLAPAYVLTAGFDPLRDEGEAYAQLMAEHGVSVRHRRYSSMIHGFFNMVAAGREAPAYNREIAGELRQALG